MRTAADWMRPARLGHAAASPEHAGPGLRSLPFERALLARLAHALNAPAIRLELWDGAAIGPPRGAASTCLTIRDRGAFYGLLRDPEMTFGDRYADGRIDVRGDLLALLEAAYRLPPGQAIRGPWPTAHSRARSEDNVHRHYDLGNDFYRLWLDEQMLYTCAYYPTPAASLEDAQVAKMELVCRKAGLRPGDRVVDAGCGWGALAIYMAQHHGATVRAFNISREQVAWARRRAADAGVSHRVEFVEEDYRGITGTCDVFVSIGMLEHVGRRQYRELGALIHRTLDPSHGRGLLHFIGRNTPAPLSRWITRRIFPGAYPPALSEVMGGVFEPWHLSVLDVENLRPHYARTLAAWRERFEAHEAEVVARYGEPFARAWRLYLAGSEAGFRLGTLQLFQVAFARERDNGVPWTRAGLYRDELAGD